MNSIVWSNKIEGNNLCLFCSYYMKERFFCVDPNDDSPVVICKYFLQVGTPEIECDLAMMQIFKDLMEY